MLPSLRWPCLLQDAQQTFTVQNKPAAVAPAKPSPIISSFLELGRRKTVDAAKICGGAENVVKTETQANIRKWIVFGFITLGIYTPLEARAYCSHTGNELPTGYGQISSALSINILRFLPVALHSDQPLSEGEIIPFSGVCQSGEAALSTPEAVVASRTD